MSRKYISEKTGRPYSGAAADEHYRKLIGFNSAEEFADVSFEAGYDAGYQQRKREERDNWKANKEAEARRSKIKAS